MQTLYKAKLKQLFYIISFVSIILTACNKEDKPLGKACFKISEERPEEGQEITFDAYCSENATNYYWYINGKEVESNNHTDIKISKVFPFGTHEIKLRITGPSGNDEITKGIIVNRRTGLYACFKIKDSTADNKYSIKNPVTFDAGCSTGSGYEWDFGDNSGDRSGKMVISHQFKETGKYEVHVAVFGDRNTFPSSTAKTITIVD